MVIAIGWTIALFVLAAVTTSGASQFVASAGVVAGVVSAAAALWAALYEPRGFSGFSDQLKIGVVIGVLVTDAVVSVWWGGWSFYRANRSINVMAAVKLDRGEGIRAGGGATLELDTLAAKRRHLVLTFEITDHNAAIGICVPTTALTVRTEAEGNRGAPIKVMPGRPAEIPLAPGLARVRLEITVTNERDKNCLIDLHVSRAVLTN